MRERFIPLKLFRREALKKTLVSLILIIGILFTYQNCGPGFRTPIVGSLASLSCGDSEGESFRNLWYNAFFIPKACASCHTSTSGDPSASTYPFSDPNINTAYGSFFSIVGANGIDHICSKATDFHSSKAVPDNLIECEGLIDKWSSCVGEGEGEGPEGRIFTTRKFITLGDVVDEGGVTLTWQLDSELIEVISDFGGASLSIVVAVDKLEGEVPGKNVYLVGWPTVTTGPLGVRIKSIMIQIGDEYFSNQTALDVIDVAVPSEQTNYRIFQGTAPAVIDLGRPIAKRDQISLAIEVIEPIGVGNSTTTTTMPPSDGVTFEDLIAPTGVFIVRCGPCHTGTRADGGYNLQTYSNATNPLFVSSGNPGASSLYLEVDSGAMPLGASKLPQGEIDSIRSWIQNNLPEN